MIKTIQIHVAGKVQGVYYRASTQQTAQQLHIDGWVSNLPDGRVHILARAEENMLQQFIAWCHQGPTYAKVTSVHVEDMPDVAVSPGFIVR